MQLNVQHLLILLRSNIINFTLFANVFQSALCVQANRMIKFKKKTKAFTNLDRSDKRDSGWIKFNFLDFIIHKKKVKFSLVIFLPILCNEY